MRRRAFITALGGAAVAPLLLPPDAHAQRPTPVIGYLGPATIDGHAEYLRAFHQALRESGLVEGENIAIEYRWAENDPTRLSGLANELVRRQVDVIAVLSAPASLAAARATTTIPIVFMVPEDPVRLGLVSSLSRPGGNLTGVNFFAAELSAKRLELLRTLVPKTARVAVLVNPAEPTIAAANLRDVEAAASAMGLEVRVFRAATIAEIDAAFAALAGDRVDGLFIGSGPFFANRRVQLAHLATRYAVPAIAANRSYSDVGGLMTYGASLADAHHQAGLYVGRILKGARPADLPVVQAAKFELVINANAARMLGLTLPPSLIAIADEVIE